MLSFIRVALVGAAISVAAIGMPTPQNATKQSPWLLKNEFVRVSVAAPLKKANPNSVDCGSTTPFVRLYVPTRLVDSAPDGPGNSRRTGVIAEYYSPQDTFGCSGSTEGSFVYVDLMAMPTQPVLEGDAVKLDRAHNEVLLENRRVRVVRIHFAPGESGPMVDKRPRVIFAVTDSHATVKFPDGRSETRDMKAGTVSFGDAGRQATKNTGTTPIENIVVELKGKESEKK
jgi:hypothetical protein